MPVKKCIYFGIPAYRWGDDDRPHMYRPEVKGSEERARAEADDDGKYDRAEEAAKVAVEKPVITVKKPVKKAKKK